MTMFYLYDPLSFAAVGSSETRTESSTATPWPDAVLRIYQTFRYRAASDDWEVVDDYRGVTMRNIQSGDEKTVMDIGPIPDGWKLKLPDPDPINLQRCFELALKWRLSEFAKQRGWKSLDLLLQQRGEFTADAAIAQEAYDRTWAAAFAVIDQIQAGLVTDLDSAMEQLPAIQWPSTEKE